MTERPEDITAQVGRLFAEGEAFADDDEQALARFRAAWDLLPDPKEEQGLAVQVLAAIANSHFYRGDWDECRQAVQDAFRCGADVANPFLRLRLGQSLR